jgi:hypothetical protein
MKQSTSNEILEILMYVWSSITPHEALSKIAAIVDEANRLTGDAVTDARRKVFDSMLFDLPIVDYNKEVAKHLNQHLGISNLSNWREG